MYIFLEYFLPNSIYIFVFPCFIFMINSASHQRVKQLTLILLSIPEMSHFMCLLSVLHFLMNIKWGVVMNSDQGP